MDKGVSPVEVVIYLFMLFLLVCPKYPKLLPFNLMHPRAILTAFSLNRNRNYRQLLLERIETLRLQLYVFILNLHNSLT